MFSKLKISNKLLLTFGATTLLLVAVVAISSHTITKYRQAVQSMQHADELKTLLDKEEKGILQLLAGFEGGSEQYAAAHQQVGDLKVAIEERATRRELPLIALINSESQVNELLGAEGGGFFDEYSAARSGFIEKNNKHVRRVLGYRNAWVTPGTEKDNKVLGILDNIRNERILVEDFNPQSPEAKVVLGDFRAANDAAVAGLVDLWLLHLEHGVVQAETEETKTKLRAMQEVVSQITATSFPAVSPENARLLGIEANEATLFGLDADMATKALTASCDEAIEQYEQGSNAPLWTRADVPAVGENVTPILALGKVVSCQQGLRVNAEDLFLWQDTYVGDIKPAFATINQDIDDFRMSVSQDVTTLAKTVQYFSLFVPVIVVILVIALVALMAKVIVKPILAVQEAATQFANGNLDKRAEVTSGDELGELAKSFNQMAENLQKSTVSKDYVDNIMSSMVDILIVADPSGKVRTTNPAACQQLGYSEEEITAMSLEDIFVSSEFGGSKIVDFIQNTSINKLEATCWSHDGRQVPVSLSGSLMRDSQGAIEGIVCVAQDITSRKQAENQLREAKENLEVRVEERTAELSVINQRLESEVIERKQAQDELSASAARLERSNRELQDFASVAAHDLQEPLRKVQAFGDRLETKYGDTLKEEGRDYLARMQNAAGRMRGLIDDLLTFSRVATKGQPFVKTDLSDVVGNVLSDLEIGIEEASATVEVSNLPTVDADPSQMRQLFQNLIANGIKFHRPEEPPIVKVKGQASNGHYDSSENGVQSDEHWQISVEDNGIGFDEKYSDRMFTIFQRLHGRNEYEGNGVGLAVCRKIVERHGGQIVAKSSEGQGAKFIITLPTKQDCGGTES